MISLKLDTRDVDRKLKNLRRAVKRPKVILNKLADDEVKNAQYRIRTSKMTPDGSRWQVSANMLYKTGFLFNSFRKKVTDKVLRITNIAPYAGYLQFGTSKMPARPFLGWGKSSLKKSDDSLQKAFEKEMS